MEDGWDWYGLLESCILGVFFWKKLVDENGWGSVGLGGEDKDEWLVFL